MLVLACFVAAVLREMIARQLDDCLAVGPRALVDKWCQSYQQVCSYLGVRLAPLDGTKAFSSTQRGTLLGVDFDLDQKVWSLSVEKTNKILYLLHDVISADWITEAKLQKLIGKLTHYMVLFSGRYERSEPKFPIILTIYV